MSLSKKQEKELAKYQEMIAKAIQNKENFEEFADNLELGLGDIRELKIPQTITGGDWCVQERVPELLVQLCRDPNYIHFVCKYILNIDLLPFQLAILQTLWHKSLPMFIGSRGCSKSFMLAVYTLVRMILQQGCKVAVVGASLRQSMVIFNYIQQIYENAPILRDICGFQGPKRDLHIAYFEIGTSRAVFLPLGNGDKIRGQRANVILADEFSCLDENTIVETSDGLVRIKDSFTIPNKQLGLIDQDGKVVKSTKYIKTPLVDVYKVTTRNGFSFKCSSIHKVKTTKGFKLAKDLTSSDYLPSPNYYTFPTKYVEGVNEELAWLMGILTSEGSINSKHSLYVQMTDKNCIDRIATILQKYTDNKVSIDYRKAYFDDRGWDCKERWTVRTCDLTFRNKLKELGLDRNKCYTKKIPHSILRSPKSVVIAYLSGLFEGDGSCFHWKQDKITNHLGIAYYSVCEQLCTDVQILLRKLDIFASKNHRKSKISDKKQWFLRINGENAYRLGKLLNISKWNNLVDTAFIYNNPMYGISPIKDRFRINGYTEGKGFNVAWADSLEEAVILRDKYYDNRIPAFKVVKVEKLEEQQHLYDYFIPNNHTFNANGFVQHNSISKEVFETVVRGFAAVKSEGVYHHVKKAAKDKALKQLNLESGKVPTNQDFTPKLSTSLANNQIILSGTPSYQFNHFYQYYKYYRAIILSGGNKDILKKEFPDVKLGDNVNAEDYAIIRLPWDVVPEGMMDASILTQGQATMDPTIFSLEYAACFAADSEGFYLASSIKDATCPLKDASGDEILFGAKLVGDKDKIYVLGIDPASEDDNFTMNVIEVNPTYRAVVYQFAINRKGFEELKRDPLVKGLGDINDYNTFCVKHIRDVCRRFNVKLICMDSGGGGVSIRESLKDSSKLLDVHDELILDPDDEYSRGLKGKQILNTIEFSKYEWRQQAHHGLRIDILHKKLLFPFYDAAAVEIASLENKSVGLGVDRLDDCYIEIEQCKQETTLIRHSQTTTGKETWDVPKIIGLDAEEIKKTLKKDRFTSLLLANWAARLVEEELEYAGIKFTGGSVQGLSQEEEIFGTAFVGKGAKKMRYLQDNFVTSISASTQGANGRTLYT